MMQGVAGTGPVLINLNSTLVLDGSFGGTVQFTNNDVETLVINDLNDFSGTIDFSQASGLVDFGNVTITSAAVNNGTLSLHTRSKDFKADEADCGRVASKSSRARH
jgi:hypothetical protein